MSVGSMGKAVDEIIREFLSRIENENKRKEYERIFREYREDFLIFLWEEFRIDEETDTSDWAVTVDEWLDEWGDKIEWFILGILDFEEYCKKYICE